MKCVSRFGMGLALLVFAMAGSSDGAIDADSTNWENSWEGDVTPPAPWADWTAIAPGGINEFTVMTEGSDTFNRFAGTSYGAGIEYNVPSEELDPDTNGGAAVEWRFRNGTHGRTWFDIAMTDADSNAEFGRFTSNKSNVNIDMLNSSESDQTGSVNSDWTTYRMVADGSTVEVFKDGASEAVFNDVGINDPRTGIMMRFWRGAGGANEFDLDYVRWTDGNPIPEPSTFAMMSIAALGLGLFRRRRRGN